MKIRYNLFPEGKKRALTLSYDDGRDFDLRLARLFDLYGLKGTFHLNGGKLGRDRYLSAEDVRLHFARHEISCHSLTHPHINKIPTEELIYEMLEDRRVLEPLCGYPVRGMSYPNGIYNDAIVQALRVMGMQYSRTTVATNKFSLPEDFMQWHPTCHHTVENLFELLEKFRTSTRLSLPVFYVWGHSYEFDRDDNWELIERFCREAGGDPEVWYATNIEIYDYVMALRGLRFSADRTMVYNPAATDVWISVDGAPVRVAGGATLHLNT